MIISQVATQVIAPFFKQQLTIEISLVYHVASPFPFWLYLDGVMHQLKVPFLPLTAIYIILSKIFQSREFPQTFAVTLAYTLLKLDCYTCCNIFFGVSLHFSNLRTADAFPVEKRRPEMRLLFAGYI